MGGFTRLPLCAILFMTSSRNPDVCKTTEAAMNTITYLKAAADIARAVIGEMTKK